MILSGVLLGALLAFVTSHLGWLRHHVRLNDRLVNAIFPLGPQVFFFTLPLWFIVALRPAVRFSGMYLEQCEGDCKWSDFISADNGIRYCDLSIIDGLYIPSSGVQ